MKNVNFGDTLQTSNNGGPWTNCMVIETQSDIIKVYDLIRDDVTRRAGIEFRAVRNGEVILDSSYSKAELFHSLIHGNHLTIGRVVGAVSAIEIESGYPGQSSCFNVTLWDGSTYHTVFTITRD